MPKCFKILRNVPEPKKRLLELRATLGDMNVGDEFFSDCEEFSCVRVSQIAKEMKIKISRRKDTEDGVYGYTFRRVK